MWYLINEKGISNDYIYLFIFLLIFNEICSGEKFYLLCKENHVGRLDGDIVLKDDQSISRKHAIIQVQQVRFIFIKKSDPH